MQVVYKNIEEYNPGKKRKVLIVFDVMIADMISNKNFNSVVTELLEAKEAKESTFYLFLLCNHIFRYQKSQTKHYAFCYYENSKQKRASANCNSSDIDFKGFMEIYKKCTAENCSFLVNDMKLPSDNPLHLQKKKFKMNI